MKRSVITGFAIGLAYYILRQRVTPLIRPGVLRTKVDTVSPGLRKLIDEIMVND